ncbi:MAG TPA: hypothetical protein VFV85_02230 [Conexibacter sp.]|nr:hypothetical protein [Conexibacter sp.]
MRSGRTFPTFLAVVALCAVALALPASPASAATRCPATFQVLHNDHVGTMSLPAGPYTVSVSGLSCASASSLFSEFLSDYDGVLPFPWVGNAATRSFRRAGSSVSFSVKAGKYPPTPPSGNVTCPGSFSVLHNDSIGSRPFPKGAYQLRVYNKAFTCQRVSQWFAQFLDDYQGDLARPWTIGAPPAGKVGGTFFVPAGRIFTALRTTTNTGGGGHTPSGGTTCGGSFSVLHNDHIGSLYLPKGPYTISLLQGDNITCAQASKQLTRFLSAATMPSPWVLDAASATFTRGIGSTVGFRIKPARVGVVR